MNWMDNKFMNGLGRIFDFVLLNLLWIVTSIPLVTIGASTSALYSVMLRIVKNEEGYILRGYLKAFKENLKKGTIIWLIILIMSMIFAVDMRVLQLLQMNEGLKKAFRAVLMILLFVIIALNLYAFPLTARYENTIRQTMKNAVILSVVKLPYTILMFLVTVGPWVLMSLHVKLMMAGMIFWPVVGVAVVAWLNSGLLRKAFLIFDVKE